MILQLQGKEAEAAKYSGQPQLRGTTRVGQTAPQKQAFNQAQKPFQAPPSPPANNYAPRSYPQANSGTPASERSGNYQQAYTKPATNSFSSNQAPRTTLRQTPVLEGAPTTSRNTTPLTASDAARLAAQQSSRRKITLPVGAEAGATTAAQSSVLERIAKTIGPQTSGSLPRRSLQANSQPQNYPQQPLSNPYPTPPQSAQYQASTAVQTTYRPQYPQGRQAARTRR